MRLLDFKKQYIENEEFELERLDIKLNKLDKKWFKDSAVKLEIKFLQDYIKLKQELLENLKCK